MERAVTIFTNGVMGVCMCPNSAERIRYLREFFVYQLHISKAGKRPSVLLADAPFPF